MRPSSHSSRLSARSLGVLTVAGLALLQLQAAAPAQQGGGGRTRITVPGAGTRGGGAAGAGEVGPGTLEVPLSEIEVPMPPDIDTYVKDMDAAIALGKALFWDVQVGSDSQTACASCHYNGGSDIRARNQMSPGPDGGFNIFESGRGGPNTKLDATDFPFHQLTDPNSADSTVLRSVDDAHTSAGIPHRIFEGVTPGEGLEAGRIEPDPRFSVSGCNLDRCEPRNAPTVINAVFFVRQFWDGRADFRFNGVNIWGDQDPNARVLRRMADGSVQEVQVSIEKASLASQAVGPLLSDFEMSWARDPQNPGVMKTIPELGKKLLPAAPLALQHVHPTDVHIGHLSNAPARGMTPGLDYAQMVRAAFVEDWWGGNGTFGGYTQMERNFALFFGLAVQLYEAQLVSDQTPFDLYEAGDETAMTEQEIRGMQRFFSGGAACADCHAGTEFAGGTWSQILDPLEANGAGMERMGMMDSGQNAVLGLTNIPAPTNPTTIGHDRFWYTPELSMGTFLQVLRPDTGQALVQGNLPHVSCQLDAAGEPAEVEIELIPGPGFPTGPVDPNDPDPLATVTLGLQALGQLPSGDCGLRIVLEVEIEFGADTPAGDYPVVANGQPLGVITLGEPVPEAVYDIGFYNIGVRPTGEDLGIGGTGPFGPLSFARRVQAGEASALTMDLTPPVEPNERVAVNGAFKASSLRNISLTGPYMHNGSMSTLEQVIQFYARGADFLEENIEDLSPGVDGVGALRNKADAQADMVAFLANGLLDPRVVNSSGPFSHPSLPRKLGAVGNEFNVLDTNGDGEANVVTDEIQATGADGGHLSIEFISLLEPGVTVTLDRGEALFPLADTSAPGDLHVMHETGAAGCGMLGLAMDSTRELRVNLATPPTSAVSVTWRSSDAATLAVVDAHLGLLIGEGTLTFTPDDWFHPQVLLLTGIQDGVQAGDRTATVSFDPFVSGDPTWSGWQLDPHTFVVEDTSATAGTIHVDAGVGAGFGNGSEQHPFGSLEEALACGDTVTEIRLAAGVYTTDLLIEGRPLRLIGAPGAVLQGSGNRPTVEIRGAMATGTLLQGLQITGGGGEAGVSISNGASVLMVACGLTGNQGNAAGALLCRNGSTVELIDCLVSGNDSMNGSGAVLLEASDLTATNSSFDMNSGREGGAIMGRNGGQITLTGCSLSSNSAYQGGALFLDGCSASLLRCRVMGNDAQNSAGACFARNAVQLSLDGTKVTGNVAPEGGGMVLDNATLQAVRSTIATNGESLRILNGVTIELTSVILWEDGTGLAIDLPWNQQVNSTIQHSIVDSTALAMDPATTLSVDPLFLDAAGGDHRVAAGSPAIDSGDPALGLDPDGSAPDMGSHPYLGN